MSCSCSASAMKLFARGLGQVHRPDYSGAQHWVLPLRGPVAPLVLLLGVGPSSRFLHLSRALRSSDADAARSEDVGPDVKQFVLNSEEDSGDEPLGMKGILKRLRLAQERDRAAVGLTMNDGGQNPKGRKKSDGQTDNEQWRAKSNYGGAKSSDRGAKRKDVRLRKDGRPRKNGRSGDDDPDEQPVKRGHWAVQKAALKLKFPEGWKPFKRLSPDALAGVRALHAQFPDVYTTETLADKFKMSPEAIRRILKSNWRPNAEEEEDRQQRWFRRGVSVWTKKAQLGINPPKRWRDEGIECDPEFEERRVRASRATDRILKEHEDRYRDKLRSGTVGIKETTGRKEYGSAKKTGDKWAKKSKQGRDKSGESESEFFQSLKALRR